MSLFQSHGEPRSPEWWKAVQFALEDSSFKFQRHRARQRVVIRRQLRSMGYKADTRGLDLTDLRRLRRHYQTHAGDLARIRVADRITRRRVA